MSLKEPIVESQMEHVHPQMLNQLKERAARCTELEKAAAEVVAELRQLSVDAFGRPGVYQVGRERALQQAADLVAEKLGVES